MEEIMIRPFDELLEKLVNIKNNENSVALVKFLKDKFLKKGLTSSIPNQVMSELLPITELSTIEMICFTEGCEEFFNDQSLDKTKYFGQSDIINYTNFIPPKEKKIEVIELDNVIKDEAEGHIRYMRPFTPIQTIAEWEMNKVTTYSFEMQREPIYKILPNGEKIKQKNINQKSVNEIADLFYNNEFEPNMITYCILAIDGKRPQVKYNKDTRKLRIELDYDVNSDTYTSVSLIDGQHRTSGATKAVILSERNNKKLNGSLHTAFYVMTQQEARTYIDNQNKQNAISKDHLEAFKNDDFNVVFAKMVNYKNSSRNIFYENIAESYMEMKSYNKLTYKTVILDAFKMTTIDISNDFKVNFEVPKYCDIITNLVKYIAMEYYDNSIDKLKDDSNLLSMNIFVGYIALAERLINNKEYLNIIPDIAEKINNNIEEINKLNLTSKNLTIKDKENIFKYFKNLI